MDDAKLHDEPGRLAALHRYEVLDTPKEAAFERLTNLVKTVLNVPMCAVSLIDANRQWFKSCVGLASTQTDRDVSFCTHTISRREPMQVPDATVDPRFSSNPFVTGAPFIRSYLGVPLSTPDGYNVGSLCAIDTEKRRYTPDQISVLQSFAALVVDELELRRIAQTDHLTGAATRRSFCVELEKALSHHRRAGAPSALLLLDIDHFKRINDTYGHAAGDIVLQSIANRLTTNLRSHDMLGRIGGEEFGILLHGATMRDAMDAAERFRGLLAHVPIAHTPPLPVTASFGIACSEDGLTAQRWLADADQALYEAKRSGRNRCIASSDCAKSYA